MASKEAITLANKKLSAAALESDHGRSERLKDEAITAAVWAFRLSVGLFVAALFVLTWHLLMPEKWCWLSLDATSQLKALMAGLFLSGGAQSYVKKYMK